MKDPHPGEVYKVDLGMAGKFRAMIVLSRHDPEAPRALALCVPITTQFRNSLYEVKLPKLKFLTNQSYANIQGIQPVIFKDLARFVGKIEPRELKLIKDSLRFAVEL